MRPIFIQLKRDASHIFEDCASLFTQDGCHALTLIVKNSEDLRAISALPDVLELNRMLVEEFHCRFTRSQALDMTLLELLILEDERYGNQMRQS